MRIVSAPRPAEERPAARVVSSPLPLGEVPAAKAAEEPLPLIRRTRPEKKRRIPKWAERLIGHIITLVIFAFVGYLMISHIRPDLFPSRVGGSGEQNEQKHADPAP